MDAPLWIPSPDRVRRARMTRFLAEARRASGRDLAGYDDLWTWSVDDRAAFWKLLWDHLEIIASVPPREILRNGDAMPGAQWFTGARLNFAENLLRFRGDQPALIALDERGGPAHVLSFDALRQQVASLQVFLRAHGVGPGDRVAAWLPNRTEAVVAMLATTALGAIWSSSSPDFGAPGVLARFGQIQPTVLFAADGTTYGGRQHDLLARLPEVCAGLQPGLKATVVIPVLHARPSLQGLPGATLWADALGDGTDDPTFAQLPFDHPVYILYSSGTTGVPKCIVHGAGGTLLQHGKELALHTDLGTDDVLMYYTTTGWMMWNWLVSGLLLGTTVVLWDGSPAWPGPDALWAAAARHRVTAFGTSPRFLAMCEQEGVEPARDHDLSALRVVLSTGSPLPAELFRWVYEHVGPDLQLASICGGTDIISCFMLGCPTEPVWAGEIQRRGLGMKVEAFGPDGRPTVGAQGELVCTAPFPSMPVGFWGDRDGSRYRRAYFDVYPGVWRHGDYITLTTHGGVIVHGRSDATLNPGGVRIGSAEIYEPVESMPEVADSVVVGLPTADDVEVVLFVVTAPGTAFDDDLVQRIRARIRTLASPRHVPARILQAPAIPRTLSGKKVEIAVQQALTGQVPPNRDALANPEALDWFAAHPVPQ